MAASQKKKEPLKLILDSNSFFIPLEFKIDIFEELKKLLNRNLEFILLSPVKQELEVLSRKNVSKKSRYAKFALQLSEKCKTVSIKDFGEPVDDLILRIAKEWNTPVFTNDRTLKKRLRDISVPVIYLRQKSRLDVDGSIS